MLLATTPTVAVAAPPRVFLPVRVGSRATLRPGTNGAIRFDLAVQVLRLRHVAVETNVGWAAPSGMLLPGDTWPRRQNLVSTGLDLLFDPSPFLAVGPTLDLDLRWYRQGWSTIGTTLIPTAGLAVDLHVFRGPWYSLAVNVETRYDLAPTELVVEGIGSQRLSPLSIEVGLRFCFGHGRPMGRTS